MSQRYGTIHAKFWDDEKVQAWPDNVLRGAVYWLTCKHMTIAGVAKIPLAYMAADLGKSEKECRTIMDRLGHDNFVSYDEKTGWGVVVKRLVYDPPKNPASFRGVLAVLDDLPRWHDGLKTIYPLLEELSIRHGTVLAFSRQDIETVPRPSRNGMPHPQPHPQPNNMSTPDDGADESDPPFDPEAGFREFYAAYPRKVKPERAKRVYQRIVRKVPHERIMAGVHRSRRKWDAAGTDLQFIPHPSSWLEAGSYDDEEEQSRASGSRPATMNGQGMDPMRTARARARETLKAEGHDQFEDGFGLLVEARAKEIYHARHAA
jgi:hypothetical protein